MFHGSDGVITHLELDILECEVKWALESITMPSGQNTLEQHCLAGPAVLRRKLCICSVRYGSLWPIVAISI